MCKFDHDIAPKCAPLSYSGEPIAEVLLKTGSLAVLQVPADFSVDGKLFTLQLAGTVEFPDSSNPPSIYLQVGTSVASVVGGIGLPPIPYTNGTYSFAASLGFTWSSVSQQLIFTGLVGTKGVNSLATGSIGTISTQSGIGFYIASNASQGVAFSSNATLTLTQFSLSA